MTRTLQYTFFAAVFAAGAFCSAQVLLLHDTFADGSRLETNLPTESGLWASSPSDVTVSVGSVRQAMAAASRRLHTYFAPPGDPASLFVGDKLVATITFMPRGALYNNTSRNFRLGLFYDAAQHPQDGVGDSGVNNSWQDATGYAVQFSLSSGTASTILVGKRTSTTDTLLGATGAYAWGAAGERADNTTLDTLYTMTFTLDYQAVNRLVASFNIAGGTVNASASLTDEGLGGRPIYTNFDFLLFRFSQASGTADIIDIRSIKIEYLKAPGARFPVPGLGQRVSTNLSQLSWTNPEPNLPGGVITCDVYFGTDPNRPLMDKKTLAAGASSVALTAANFPRFVPLQNTRTYYWFVDCRDSTRPGVMLGQAWYFNVNNNQAPIVNAGLDQTTWGLPKTIALSGTVSDDGWPIPPGAFTVQWTQDSGPSVTISPANQLNTSVPVTQSGVYVFRLTANDGELQTSDTVRVVVGATSCEASHLNTGLPYATGDFNKDCIVDLADFAEFISKNWRTCTNLLVGCD